MYLFFYLLKSCNFDYRDILQLINNSGRISLVITRLAATNITEIKTNTRKSSTFNIKRIIEEEFSKVMRSLDIKTGALHSCTHIEY